MSLKNYIILMLISTVISWISLVFIILYVDILAAGFLALLLFYLSLSLALTGTFFLFGFFIRFLFQRKTPLFRHLSISFRQAIFFTLLIVGSLILQAARLLTWWNLILFILFLIILEFFFLIKKSSYGR